MPVLDNLVLLIAKLSLVFMKTQTSFKYREWKALSKFVGLAQRDLNTPLNFQVYLCSPISRAGLWINHPIVAQPVYSPLGEIQHQHHCHFKSRCCKTHRCISRGMHENHPSFTYACPSNTHKTESTQPKLQKKGHKYNGTSAKGSLCTHRWTYPAMCLVEHVTSASTSPPPPCTISQILISY